MKRLVVLSLIIAGFLGDAGAVVRGGATTSSGGAATSARAATRGGVVGRAPARTVGSGAASGSVIGRSATKQTAGKPVVAARAGVTQKVIGSGTKVAAAAKNVVVNQACQEKYEGCMDAFCMLDNASGGRCLCSDKNKELDAVLREIEKLDERSFQMATVGVEKIEMGLDADMAIANANAVANSLNEKQAEEKKSTRKTLDLSAWDVTDSFEEEEVFEQQSLIEGQTGDALYSASHQLCASQMSECSGEMDMLRMLYTQRIKADCTAYENSLKQKKTQSAQKLATAEAALREAALEQLKTANKWDLGQCTLQFRKCMQTTAECGDDFSACASVQAMDNTNTRKSTSRTPKTYKIKGNVTNIEISGSTYDTLEAKKPLCESVTRSCVAVADQVWDTFLREVAPQLKNAELIAENKARQDCIGNISSCFQQACKDNMDPNNEASYDMCLSRPETMLNLCKVPLNACGIDASSERAAAESQIWDFVVARLQSMRVDACTTEVKKCLQHENRCGKDYSNCIGLDLDSLHEMCPLDVLVACQQKSEVDGSVDFTASWDNIDTIVQGIWLSVDNAMLDQCQNLVNEKMIELCGDTVSCALFEEDETIGTDSLTSYVNEDGDTVIDGLLSFGDVKVNKPTSLDNDVKFSKYEINIGDYKSKLNENDPTASRVVAALQSTATRINQKIAILSNDEKIRMCVEGRDISQVRGRDAMSYARFPNLLDSSILTIIDSGLEQANKNYSAKYNDLVAAAIEKQNDSIKAATCAAFATNPNADPECTRYISDADTHEPVCVAYDNSRPYDDLFGDITNAGMNSDGTLSLRYVVNGANISDALKIASSGHGEWISTDEYGNMLGSVTISATYSEADNVCTVTTTTMSCEDTEKIITTNKLSVKKIRKGGVIEFGNTKIVANRKIRKLNISQEEYHGAMCKTFKEPVITTNKIKM